MRSVAADNIQVGDLASFREFLVINEKHGFGAFDASRVIVNEALGKASDLE